MTPVLEAESIGKRFGERKILTAAYLGAEAGKITGLLGRNGEGKSTLLKICAGLVAADHGTVRFGGEFVARPRLHRLARRGLFWLPADRGYLSPARTLREHLEAVGQQLGLGEYGEAVEATGTAAWLDERCAAVSGGERRLAELAVAYHRRPACLLADEPLLGLSPLHAEAVGALFRAMAARGCAVVVTGHEINFLLTVVDEVVWLTQGSTRLLGKPDEAKASWRFRRDFLGTA